MSNSRVSFPTTLSDLAKYSMTHILCPSTLKLFPAPLHERETSLLWNTNRNLYTRVLNGISSNDLERVMSDSKIFNDTEHRAASLRQLTASYFTLPSLWLRVPRICAWKLLLVGRYSSSLLLKLYSVWADTAFHVLT